MGTRMAWVACVVRSHCKTFSRKPKATLVPLAMNLLKFAEGRWKTPDVPLWRFQTWQVLFVCVRLVHAGTEGGKGTNPRRESAATI